jgi:hypothetical protein
MLYPRGKALNGTPHPPSHTDGNGRGNKDKAMAVVDSLPLIAEAITGALIPVLANARPRQRGG